MSKRKQRRASVVFGVSRRATRGLVTLGPLRLPCALGRSGRGLMKREGDGLTPIGAWAVRAVYYRADRIARPRGGVRIVRLDPDDGWCDAPDDRNYNRRVRHPYPASAERLWRDDGLYDVIVVLGFNDLPRRRGRGSAIFMHVARPGFRPTAGCVALRLPDLLRLIERLGTHGIVRVGG